VPESDALAKFRHARENPFVAFLAAGGWENEPVSRRSRVVGFGIPFFMDAEAVEVSDYALFVLGGRNRKPSRAGRAGRPGVCFPSWSWEWLGFAQACARPGPVVCIGSSPSVVHRICHLIQCSCSHPEHLAPDCCPK
jgi:hypothetical protein